MTDKPKVVYVTGWIPWYKCSKCDHVYGKNDPLDTHFDKCCPSCGVLNNKSYVPPHIKGVRRFCYTKKPNWFQRTFLFQEDEGYADYIWSDSENETLSDSRFGGLSPLTGLPLTSLNTAAVIGAVSIM